MGTNIPNSLRICACAPVCGWMLVSERALRPAVPVRREPSLASSAGARKSPSDSRGSAHQQHGVDGLALGPRLLRDQVVAQHLGRVLRNLRSPTEREKVSARVGEGDREREARIQKKGIRGGRRRVEPPPYFSKLKHAACTPPRASFGSPASIRACERACREGSSCCSVAPSTRRKGGRGGRHESDAGVQLRRAGSA
eukprot:239743-Pleurochrysis_carterae.AAC.1